MRAAKCVAEGGPLRFVGCFSCEALGNTIQSGHVEELLSRCYLCRWFALTGRWKVVRASLLCRIFFMVIMTEKRKEKLVEKKSNHPIKLGGRRKAAVDPQSRRNRVS